MGLRFLTIFPIDLEGIFIDAVICLAVRVVTPKTTMFVMFFLWLFHEVLCEVNHCRLLIRCVILIQWHDEGVTIIAKFLDFAFFIDKLGHVTLD